MKNRAFAVLAFAIALNLGIGAPALGVEIKANCVSISLDSYNQMVRPAKDSDVSILISYYNTCSTEASNVEIALATRAGLDWRIITTGGKLGQVPAYQRGQVSIRLSYYSFSETSEIINLYVKEDYPQVSKKYVAVTMVTFTKDSPAAMSPTPTPVASSTPAAQPTDPPASQESPSTKSSMSPSRKDSKGAPSVKANTPCEEEGAVSLVGKDKLVCKKNDQGLLVWTKVKESPTPEPTSASPSVEAKNSPQAKSGMASSSGINASYFLIMFIFVTIAVLISVFITLRWKRKTSKDSDPQILH